MKKSKKQIIWEWVTPSALILAAFTLVEVAHLYHAWWSLVAHMLGWWFISSNFFRTHRRWRHAEIALIRHVRLPRGLPPRISLRAGQDLTCGAPVVVNDRGFVVAPDEFSYPPPANPVWVTGTVDNEDD